MNLIWLVRMSKWARNPPSPQRVKLVLGIIALCLIIVGIEVFLGWPEWLTTNGNLRGGAPKF